MIRLDVTPTAKPRMTGSDRWKKRPPVIRYYNFKDAIKERAQETGFELGDAFRAVFLIPMPKSWTKKKKRAMAGQKHQQVPDTDNLLKAVKDCLLKEDSFVWDEHGIKIWTAGEGAILIENITQAEQARRLNWIKGIINNV